MGMFKPGDTVRCTRRYHLNLEVGKHYIISDIRYDSFIRLSGHPLTHWNPSQFELVRSAGESMEERLEKKMNPAIEEYTKTVTVRKIRPKSVIKFNGSNSLEIISRGSTVELSTTGLRRNHIYVNADDLRTLAKQLTEIADVLEEGKS